MRLRPRSSVLLWRSLITNRLWKNNVYTEKEMVAIMTGFSAVSIGFAGLVIETAGCGKDFAKI